MGFEVSADAYGRFMGRFSEPLADRFAAELAPERGETALDVGCGPGALTARLVDALGIEAVAAVDPSESFVAAARERFPGADIRLASAEALPFDDDRFDIVAAQLVVHFMTDAVAGLREMARVARPGGRVGACVWDHAAGTGPLGVFWSAARELDPDAADESQLPGAREGHLAQLFDEAGIGSVRSFALTVTSQFPGFDEWWEPMTLGVGRAGGYVAELDDSRREALRARCADLLPSGPFEIPATAWTAVGAAE